MAIKIDVITDVAQAVSGTGKLADKYNDVSDALMDVARDGDTAGDKIEAAFRDGAKDVTRTEKALKDAGREGTQAGNMIEKGLHEGTTEARKMDDALDALGKTGRKAGDDIGDNVKDGTRKAGEGLDELKDEANSTAKEAAASFDGSAESIGDVFQEVAANAFAGFGPAGAAAGLAVAAGIGIAISSLQQMADETNGNAEEAMELAQTIRENGGTFGMKAAIDGMTEYGDSIADTKEWWEIFQDKAVTGWEEMRKQSEASGQSLQQIFAGRFTGDLSAAESGLVAVNKKLDELRGSGREVSKVMGKEIDTRRELTQETKDQIATNESLKKAYEDHIAQIKLAEIAEQTRKASIKGTTEALLDQLQAEDKAAQGKSSIIDINQASAQAFRDLTASIEKNGTSLDETTEAGGANVDVLQEMVQNTKDMVSAQYDAGKGVVEVSRTYRDSYDRIVDTVSKSFGKSKADAQAYVQELGAIAPEKLTELKLQGKDKAIADGKEAAKKEEKPVDLTVTGADGVQKQIASLPSDVPVHVGVTEQGTVGMTQTAIDSIHGHDVRVGATEEGTARMTQATIDRVHGHDVRVGATEQGTARQTQETIDRIHGKDVPIRARLENYWEIRQLLDQLSAPRSVSVTVNEVPGRRVDH